MTDRLREICASLPACGTFADVGCDHGYCAEYMLKSGRCARAYLTDISRESLKKAEKLLADYIARGQCVPVCCDGLQGVPERCDCVLIAGMGGEEILHVLGERELPDFFALQPMKNADKVRRYLISRGAKILRDYTFRADGKYYDYIVGRGSGGDEYADYEFYFGRDNLKRPSAEFYEKLKEEQGKLKSYACARVSEENRAELRERLLMLEEVIDAIENDL